MILAEPTDYEGERTEQAFVDFLNEKCGTQRVVGGGLSKLVRNFSSPSRGFPLHPFLAYHDLTHPQAGRLPQLDELASQFFLTSGAARDAIYKQASELAASIGPSAKHYVRVMEKVSNGSEEYFEKESKRYVALPSSLPPFLPFFLLHFPTFSVIPKFMCSSC